MNKQALQKMIEGTSAERRFLSEQSFGLFALYYFQHYFTYSLAGFHYDFFQDCEDMVENKIRECMWIAFREAGKSSMAKISIIWQIATKKRKYLNVDSFDRENAERMLFDIAVELTSNKRLQADFGILFSKKKGLDEIKQNRITNFVTENGIRIEAHSTSESVRGRIHGNQRPDALYLDDFENNRTKDSDAFTKQVKDHITEAQAGMAPNGYILYLGNYLTEYGNVQWIMDRAITDKGIRVRNIPIMANDIPSWGSKYALTDVEAKATGKVSIEDKRRQLGSQVFSYEMLNQPIDDSIAEFKKEWIQKATEDELKHMQCNTFITIDSAISEKEVKNSDYTAITINRVSRENKWYIETYHTKMNSAELIDHMFYLNDTYKPTAMGLEKTTFTTAIKPFFEEKMRERNKFFTVIPLEHHGTKKETRIRSLIPRYEGKSIFHVGNCKDLEDEMRVFPRGNNDDCLDSLAYQDQIAYKPAGLVEQGYTPVNSTPKFTKNMLTGKISYA